MVKYKWYRTSQFLIYHPEMKFTLLILMLKVLTQRLLMKIPLKFSKNDFLHTEFSILTKFASVMVPIFNWLMFNDPMWRKNMLWGIIQPYLLFTVPENFHLLMLFWVETQSDYVELLPSQYKLAIGFNFSLLHNLQCLLKNFLVIKCKTCLEDP